MRTAEDVGFKRGTELHQSIANHPFFHGINPRHLEDVVRGAREVAFEAGQVLFREGEPANCFFLIKEGEVEIESRIPPDRSVVIQTIGPQDVLGWSWLVAPYWWHFTARAIKPARVIALDGAHLLVVCEKDPVFGYDLLKRILKIVLGRLQATRTRLGEVGARVAPPA
jgi:CRP-like cAMP-binding protein